jgi:glycosyltransferase involved in cell wall biosynthesis
MLITVGILAYNEEHRIGSTIRSLLHQSCFLEESKFMHEFRWEFVVVPNGCSDKTAENAAIAFASSDQFVKPNFKFSVRSLDKPGKSNAWNTLIHQFADQETDFFVLLDADIEFREPDTVFNCLKVFEKTAAVQVVTDHPIKRFSDRSKFSVIQRISTSASQAGTASSAAICGQFYCARGAALRRIYLPIGLSVEDGFVLAMVVTDCFRERPNMEKVLMADNASHYYEGLVNLKNLIQHEVRIVVGTTLNCYLCWDTLFHLVSSRGQDAGELIRQLNEDRPDWYSEFIQNSVLNRGAWTLPRGMLFRRFRYWSTSDLDRSIKKMSIAALAFVFDLVVFFLANRKLKNRNVVGYW